ncbi:histidine phosphatase family protein [Alkalinema pantanalense CENA528]|uniref:histidine phosphatase family protein n=1 Tax=Alkalinema pantanalense TaxID=1620705 RepID=UPI003D6FAEB2
MQFLKLLFIRHAESTGNIERRMQGQGEYPLTEHGKIQAEKLGQALLKEGWIPTHVYSSPLRRTLQTTKLALAPFQSYPPAYISDLTNAPSAPDLEPEPVIITYMDDLKEFHNGIFQGLTWSEARTRYPDLCHKLESTPDWIPVPEAETLQEIRDRAHRFIQKILTRHKNGDRLWIVTHSGFLPHLIAEVLGVDRSWRISSHNTAMFEFWIDHDRWHLDNENRYNTDLWQIRRFNDHRHLTEGFLDR